MKIKKEVKIGAFVLITFILLIWGLNFLKGRDIFFRGNIYYGVFSKVDGLTDASPIYYHGFKIGTVRDINIDQREGDRFIVTFALNKELSLPSNSVAQIYSLDLLGSKGVQFIKGSSSSFLQPYDTLSTSIMADLADQLSTNVLPLKDKTEKLISRFDTVLAQVGVLFREDNVENLNNAIAAFSQSMRNMEALTANLSNYTGENGAFKQTTQRIDSILEMLARQGQNLDSTMSSMAIITSEMKNAGVGEALASLKTTIQQADTMMRSINDADGSLGMLINDKAMYKSLSEASANLNRLLVDIRYNPKRYVSFSAFDFGKKNYYDASLTHETIRFWVKVATNNTPGNFDKSAIADKYYVTEFYDGKNYLHITGESMSYADVYKIKEQIKQFYPLAEIIAIENHKVVDLKKALKKINK